MSTPIPATRDDTHFLPRLDYLSFIEGTSYEHCLNDPNSHIAKYLFNENIAKEICDFRGNFSDNYYDYFVPRLAYVSILEGISYSVLRNEPNSHIGKYLLNEYIAREVCLFAGGFAFPESMNTCASTSCRCRRCCYGDDDYTIYATDYYMY